METQQPDQATYKDKIVMQSVVSNLSYLDRLRIFVGYPLHVTSEVFTENIVGRCQGVTVIKAVSPFALKTYSAQ